MEFVGSGPVGGVFIRAQECYRRTDGDAWFGFVLVLAEISGRAAVGVEVLVGGRLVAHRICQRVLSMVFPRILVRAPRL